MNMPLHAHPPGALVALLRMLDGPVTPSQRLVITSGLARSTAIQNPYGTLAASVALGQLLLLGELDARSLNIVREGLADNQPGNCWSVAAANFRCAAARKLGVDCYVRCWHEGEVGWFVIRSSDYTRVLETE